jgi:hypothetical protein
MPLAKSIGVVPFVIAAIVGQADSGVFRSLFDGKTLQGWHRFGGNAKTWGVEGDRLIGYGEGGGWLGTERDYADFVLHLEFKVAPGANSGVYLRAPADLSHISRTGLEIQILDDAHSRYRSVKPWQLTGAVYHVSAPKPGHLKPAGAWNTMEIRAEGPHIIITLNDAVVVDDQLDRHPELETEHTGLKRTGGRIGLQSHDGRVEFREIRIREITK